MIDPNISSSEAKIIAETTTAIVVSKTLTQASQLLKISRPTLYDRINKYDLKNVINPLAQEASFTLYIASLDAAEELVKQLSNWNVKVRAEAAKEILDRIGIRGKV